MMVEKEVRWFQVGMDRWIPERLLTFARSVIPILLGRGGDEVIGSGE